MSIRNEVDPVQKASRLTSGPTLKFGWTCEHYQQALALLRAPYSRRRLRLVVLRKKGGKRKEELTLADRLLEEAKKYQVLYGGKPKEAPVERLEITERGKAERGKVPPQKNINIVSLISSRSGHLEALSTPPIPGYSLKRVTETSSLGMFFGEIDGITQKVFWEPVIVFVEESEEVSGAAKRLLAYFEAVETPLPENIRFIGVASSRAKIPQTRSSLQLQLGEYSDRLIGVTSKGGNNQQLCRNLIKVFQQLTFPQPRLIEA